MPGKHKSSRLLKYLDGLVVGLGESIPKAIEDSDRDAIHLSRVSTRRLKAALDLIEPKVHADHIKPFARSLRRIRRRLGKQRDIDVMRKKLDEEVDHKRHEAAVAWMSNHLPKRRAGGKSKTGKFLGKLSLWQGVREEIVGLGDDIETLLQSTVKECFAAFVDQANRLTNKQEAKDDPHQVRIEGKSLRYTLEMLRAQSPRKLPARTLTTFKRMQDALGDWHDRVVLAERAMSESAEEMLALHDPKLQQRVLDLTRAELKRADSDLAKFGKIWISNREKMLDVICKACEPEPAEPVIESQTDRDPSHSPLPAEKENPPSIERGAA